MADGPSRSLTRFDTPSARLDLGAVGGRQMRKVRMISLVAAVVLHGSLAIWKVSMERKATKPLTTRFIKREPRLVKPLELRKAPKPKRREMRRRMKQVRAKVDTRGIARAPGTSRVLDSMAKVAASVTETTSFERPELEPLIESHKVRAAKTSGQELDIKLEMVDVASLDYGRDRAMVVQDLTDRRRISGFFNVVAVYLASNELFGSGKGNLIEHYKSFDKRVGGRALADLAEAVNELTDIKVDVVDDIAASDERLLEIPWAVMSPGNGADLLPSEALNIGKYLTAGGFLMVEGGWVTEPRCRNLFRKSLEAVGLRQGPHWEFEILPNDHPIYHSFYDFDGAPWGGDVFVSREGVGYTQETQLYKYPLERRDTTPWKGSPWTGAW